MSERAALDLLCSISDLFTELCLYMTIACEWRVVMGPETHEECATNAQQSGSLRSACSTAQSLHNRHACILQPDPRSLVGSRDRALRWLQGSKLLAGRLQVTSYTHQLLA
jgi:hypothetical protein